MRAAAALGAVGLFEFWVLFEEAAAGAVEARFELIAFLAETGPRSRQVCWARRMRSKAARALASTHV